MLSLVRSLVPPGRLLRCAVLTTQKTQEELYAGTRKVAERINREFEGQEVVLVCVLKGCVFFFVDLTRNLTIPFSIYFLEASSYHDEQTQTETVEILRSPLFSSQLHIASISLSTPSSRLIVV